MGKRAYIAIPVTGPLNTADPSTNRPVGTLLQGIDASTKAIGPRRGMEQQTWPGRIPTSVSIYTPGATPDFSFDGSSTYVKGTLAREQADLGNKWTLDLAFHAFAARTTANAVQIFQWKIDSSIVAIEVGHYGSTHAQANRLYAIVKTTSSAGVVGATHTLVGGVVPFAAVGSYVSGGAATRVMVRLTRDGTTLRMTDSIGATDTDTSLTSGYGHAGTTTQSAFWYFGRDTTLGVSTTFNGLIHRVMMRDRLSEQSVIPLSMVECPFARSNSIRFSAGTALMTNVHVADHSSFGSHGLVSTPGTAPTINTERHYPLAKVVQGFGSFTDRDGIKQSMVLVGGLRCFVRAR